MSESPDQARRAEPAPAPAAPRAYATLALVLAMAALLLAAWQWFDSRRGMDAIGRDVAKRLAEIDAAAHESRALAAQSRDAMSDANARLGQLEARMFETQNQRLALESLYRDLSRGRDEWTLAEVEQVLLIANQQLQLAGNVKAALIALESADARLARMDRPQLTALRRVIGQDMEKLRAAPYADVVGMALRLDNVASQVDGLPLGTERRPTQAGPQQDAATEGFWRRGWRELARDIRELIRIQNVERPEPPLLAPEQAYFLRENLRLRLLGARLSLLARDEASFRADVKAASGWLARYFDASSKPVAAAQATLAQLQRVDFGTRVPDISASLDAARSLRIVHERALR
ncbi:MAG TPA: uroporphyrinogen-III C-methyltransferase [Burkholderiales bacterium]|nr:uroporphyrinogen-III C-methyltransferase [Burkholderiales bacterium]